MASVKPTSTGYRAQVYVKGVRDSQVFRLKREAEAWASKRETELRELATRPDRHTLQQAFDKYAAEVSPTKRGSRWEILRLNAFKSTGLDTTIPIGEITPNTIGQWRDRRLQEVSAGTILRDFGLLSAVFEQARREWGWIKVNPMVDVRKPRQPDHREVLITMPQVKAMLRSLGYSPRKPIRTVSQSVAVAFLLSIRTGMRAGEVCGLTWDRVYPDYCRLPVTKTVPRDVPLSVKARRLINKMRGFDELMVMGVTVQTLDALFRRARNRAGLSGFVYHDSRRLAATMISKKVDILMLTKIFGWTDPKMAMVYYAPRVADMAKCL